METELPTGWLKSHLFELEKEAKGWPVWRKEAVIREYNHLFGTDADCESMRRILFGEEE